MLTFKQLGNYGRLGNQMFQYATLYSVAKRNNFDIKIPKGNYDLLNFNIDKNFLLDDDNIDNNYNEPYFHYSDNVFKINDNTDMCGYFQSYKYFENIRHILIDKFSCEYVNHICSQIIDKLKKQYNKDITSIHIRRGDYLKYPNIHPICTLKYYQESIQSVQDNIFLIFSDDLQWCKKQFNDQNMLYITNSNVFDFTLMSKCDNNIISNSSYSWWAAYLNKNENKIIKYPSIWFGADGPKDIFDLIPKSWSKIEC
jgi:hypothetical protein